MSKSFATIKRGQATLTSLDVTETLAQEQIALAKLLEQETEMEFTQAMDIINDTCNVLLPGHRGVAKLKVFRTIIRDRLKAEFIGYEESRDHQATLNDARNLGNP